MTPDEYGKALEELSSMMDADPEPESEAGRVLLELARRVEEYEREHFPWVPMCVRCYAEGELFPAKCSERPELLVDSPIGQYHCPDCGAMVMAGVPHGPVCVLCRDRNHPAFDVWGAVPPGAAE